MIDSHAHIISEFFDSIELTLEECINNNVIGIIDCADSLETSYEIVNLSNKNKDFLYPTVGIHPDNIDYHSFDDILKLEELICNQKIVAIGEIGLDYYHKKENKDAQKAFFIKQIALAKKYDLPVLIHSRDATDDMIKILKENKPKGIVHCFSGSIETAREYLKIGLFLGIGGVVTFKNSKLSEVVKEIPIENIVLETDCPFLTPEPFRGKSNSPKYLYHIAKKIAEIKNISIDDVIKITTENCKVLFNI